jgi:sugar lactone lactonase YvrE
MKKCSGLVLVFAIVSQIGTLTAQRAEPVIVVQGAPLHLPNGIHFGPDGDLYVASVIGREIVVLDPETGEIRERLGPESGVESPDDLAFAPDGTLYWTSILTGDVGRRTPDGTTTRQRVAPGVNPITVSDDGRVFVALCFLGDAIYELDPELVEPPRLIVEDVGDGCGSNGMDWGPDGFLYGPRWFQGTVVRTDVATGTATVVATDFGTPAAVKFDSRGRLHVVDTASGEIVRVNVGTGAKETVATLAPGLDNLAFDASDRLYVSSFARNSVVEVRGDDPPRSVIAGGPGAPGGVAVLDGSLYLADVLSIQVFDAETGESLDVIPDVIGFTDVSTPLTISVSGSRLVVTSWFSNTVQVWDPDLGQVVEEHHDLNVPLDAVEFGDDLVVSELGSGRVVRISAEDPEARVPMVDGVGVPAGLAAAKGDLWVADRAAGTVLQVAAAGEALPRPVTIATGLEAPEGLAVAADGRLVVVEAGAGRLSAIEPDTGTVTTVVEGLELGAPGIDGAPPTWIFNDVAVSRSGTIYVTGDITNVVYRIDALP